MKKIAIAIILTFATASTGAYAATCKQSSVDMKLAGAALSSHMKKCEADAQKSCDAAAAEKKLAGAAKTSFTKKCVTDAVGS